MTISRRTRLLLVVGTAVLLLGAGLVSSAASAVSHGGKLLIKGPGTTYNGPWGAAAEAVAAGATDQLELKVVNTGTTGGSFDLLLTTSGLPATTRLYSSPLALFPMSPGPDGYRTRWIAPGGSQVLVLRVAIPAGSPQGDVTSYVSLYAGDGTFLNTAQAITEVKAPVYGTTATDLFAKEGTQPYVGGSVNGQVVTSPGINPGESAVFTLKLQNDGPVPAAIRLRLADVLAVCTRVSITDGGTNVVADVFHDEYSTPVLAVHEARLLTVTFRRTSTTGCGAFDHALFVAHDDAGTEEHWVSTLATFPAG
jgi:hypothetical protein